MLILTDDSIKDVINWVKYIKMILPKIKVVILHNWRNRISYIDASMNIKSSDLCTNILSGVIFYYNLHCMNTNSLTNLITNFLVHKDCKVVNRDFLNTKLSLLLSMTFNGTIQIDRTKTKTSSKDVSKEVTITTSSESRKETTTTTETFTKYTTEVIIEKLPFEMHKLPIVSIPYVDYDIPVANPIPMEDLSSNLVDSSMSNNQDPNLLSVVKDMVDDYVISSLVDLSGIKKDNIPSEIVKETVMFKPASKQKYVPSRRLSNAKRYKKD